MRALSFSSQGPGLSSPTELISLDERLRAFVSHIFFDRKTLRAYQICEAKQRFLIVVRPVFLRHDSKSVPGEFHPFDYLLPVNNSAVLANGHYLFAICFWFVRILILEYPG